MSQAGKWLQVMHSLSHMAMFARHRRTVSKSARLPTVTPESLVRAVEDFLAQAHDAIVVEDGAVAFDLSQAKYSVSGERNKCLLHLWSAERNMVRRVLDVGGQERRTSAGSATAGPDPSQQTGDLPRARSPHPHCEARGATGYQRVCSESWSDAFPDSSGRITTAMDLERSFGPIYARGLIRHGQSAFAVLGVNAAGDASSMDAALTFGILWLDVCRQSHAGKMVVEGLKLILPRHVQRLTRERMAHLNPKAAKWQLYELEEREDSLKEMDISDRGNVRTRLVHWTDEADGVPAVRGRDQPGSGTDARSGNGGDLSRRDRLPLSWTGVCPRAPGS